MHILIAPNAFKNSLNATKVAEAIRSGLQKSKLNCTTVCFPIADGGDGTAELLIEYLKGVKIAVQAEDPLGRSIQSYIGWVENTKTAIIELASASGLKLLNKDEYDPLQTSTGGTGDLFLVALNLNPEKIIFCIGGSATVDGGTGILKKLGVHFYDKEKNELDAKPEALRSLYTIDISALDKRINNVKIEILCDVENVLLGTEGAAATFGPQKGADPEKVKELESFLQIFREVILKDFKKDISTIKYGGAAGGVSAGLNALLNAELVNGIDQFLDITEFDKELAITDLVITGEGSLDETTLKGKAPFGVAARARKRSKKVIGIGGSIPATITSKFTSYFDRLVSINEGITDIDIAMKKTFENLQSTAERLGDEIYFSNVQN